MNKLTECESFNMVEKSWKGSILKNITELVKNTNDYAVEYPHYEHLVKVMRSYRYSLAPFIVSSVLNKEIIPLLAAEPKDTSKKSIVLPTMINTFSDSAGKIGYVDISMRGTYNREKSSKLVNTLKIKELDLYGYLQSSLLETTMKKHEGSLSSSRDFLVHTTKAYATLFVKAIDRHYPISTDVEGYQVAIYLASLYCLTKMIGKEPKAAIQFIFASKISDKKVISAMSKSYISGKVEFENFTDFIQTMESDLSNYIKSKSMTLRNVIHMYSKMYGANSMFAAEHLFSFINMCFTAKLVIGFYSDRTIVNTVGMHIEKLEKVFLSTVDKK